MWCNLEKPFWLDLGDTSDKFLGSQDQFMIHDPLGRIIFFGAARVYFNVHPVLDRAIRAGSGEQGTMEKVSRE